MPTKLHGTFYSMSEVANELGLTTGRVRQMQREHQFKATTFGGKTLIVAAAEVAKLKRQRSKIVATLLAAVLTVLATSPVAAATFDFGKGDTIASLGTTMSVRDNGRPVTQAFTSVRSDWVHGDLQGVGTLDGFAVTVSDVRLGPFDIDTSGTSTFSAWSDGAWREYTFSFTAKSSTTIAIDEYAAYIKPYSPKSSRGYPESGEPFQSTLDEPIAIDWSVQGPETLVSGTELVTATNVIASTSPFNVGPLFQFRGPSWDVLTDARIKGESVVFDGDLDGADITVAVGFSSSARLVPEPSSLVLLAVGTLLGLIRFARP